MDWADIAIRAGKTFVQAFVAALVLPAANAFDLASWKAAVVAAAAAGLSAAWNIVIEALRVKGN
jgi:hypothetical protein